MNNPLQTIVALTEAFLTCYGSFPLDETTPNQRKWKAAMTSGYDLVGPGYGSDRREAIATVGQHAKLILELSTAHLTDEVAQKMPDRAFRSEFGWVMIASPEACGLPECVAAAQNLALTLGCDYIIWDADLPTIEGLPIYDW